jgi:hypothetical protein
MTNTEKTTLTATDIDTFIAEAIKRSNPDDRDTAYEMPNFDVDFNDPASVDRWEVEWARAHRRAAMRLIGVEGRRLKQFAVRYPEAKEAVLEALRGLRLRWVTHAQRVGSGVLGPARNPDACPACGSLPGQGTTPGCECDYSDH